MSAADRLKAMRAAQSAEANAAPTDPAPSAKEKKVAAPPKVEAPPPPPVTDPPKKEVASPRKPAPPTPVEPSGPPAPAPAAAAAAVPAPPSAAFHGSTFDILTRLNPETRNTMQRVAATQTSVPHAAPVPTSVKIHPNSRAVPANPEFDRASRGLAKYQKALDAQEALPDPAMREQQLKALGPERFKQLESEYAQRFFELQSAAVGDSLQRAKELKQHAHAAGFSVNPYEDSRNYVLGRGTALDRTKQREGAATERMLQSDYKDTDATLGRHQARLDALRTTRDFPSVPMNERPEAVHPFGVQSAEVRERAIKLLEDRITAMTRGSPEAP